MMKHPTLLNVALDVWKAGRDRSSALVTRQHRRLLNLIEFARRRSPFYLQLYSDLPEGINDLRLLPPVAKPELMARFDEWVTDPAVTRAGVEAFVADKTLVGQPYLGRYFVCTTSGTTGHPAILLHDPDAITVYLVTDMLRVYPAWMTPRLLWAMLRAGGRTASVIATGDHFGAFAMMERTRKLSPWLDGYLNRKGRVLSVTKPLSELVQELNEFQPARLMGYSTAMALLAEEQAAGRLQIKPILVGTVGEWLAPTERERIRAVFHCPVRDTYGSSECFSDAFDCEYGWLHVSSDWVILEPVDEAYRSVPAGQPSHTVLLTNLANYVQPFIRYDQGDSIIVRPDPCPCGSPLPAIRVEGRRDEILHMQTPNGDVIPLLPMAVATVVEGTPGVRRFQVIQAAPTVLRLRLEVTPGEDETQVWTITASRLREYLTSQGLSSVSLEHDPEPPKPNPISGKFRHVWAELAAPRSELRNVPT